MNKIVVTFVFLSLLSGVTAKDVELEKKKNLKNKITIFDIIKKMKKNPANANWNQRKIRADGMTRLGIHAEALDPELALYFEVKHGILVKKIVKKSAAETAGIKVGDIIVSSQTQTIKTIRDMIKSLQNNEDEDVDIKIVRRGQELDLLVKFPPPAIEKKDVAVLQKTSWRSMWTKVMNQSWFGLSLHKLTPELIAFLKTGHGILVLDVKKGTQAEKLGFKVGDVITAWGDQTVKISQKLKQLIGNTKVEVATDVALIRDEKTIHLQISVEFDPNAHKAFFGVEYNALTPQLAKYFKVKSGILISSILKKSPAESAGLQAGDILIGWNDKPLTSPKNLVNLLAASKAKEIVKVLIVRNGDEKHFEVTLGMQPKTSMEKMNIIRKKWRNKRQLQLHR